MPRDQVCFVEFCVKRASFRSVYIEKIIDEKNRNTVHIYFSSQVGYWHEHIWDEQSKMQ